MAYWPKVADWWKELRRQRFWPIGCIVAILMDSGGRLPAYWPQALPVEALRAKYRLGVVPNEAALIDQSPVGASRRRNFRTSSDQIGQLRSQQVAPVNSQPDRRNAGM